MEDRREPPRLGGPRIGDDWYRRCPICKRIYTVLQLGENHNRCPRCGILILS